MRKYVYCGVEPKHAPHEWVQHWYRWRIPWHRYVVCPGRVVSSEAAEVLDR